MARQGSILYEAATQALASTPALIDWSGWGEGATDRMVNMSFDGTNTNLFRVVNASDGAVGYLVPAATAAILGPFSVYSGPWYLLGTDADTVGLAISLDEGV